MRNRYEGPCYQCGEKVAPGAGHFQKHGPHWLVHHAECAIKYRNLRRQLRRSQTKGLEPMAKEKSQGNIKLTTPVFRASFANVFKPRVGFQGTEPVYSVEMLFTKKEKMDWLKAAIKKVADAKWPDGLPKNFRSPIKDGDEKELEGYAGNWFVTCKSKVKPGIVDKNLDEIIEPSEFYSGCYAKATVTVAAYSKAGNNGVAVYLGNLQKTKDGEAFSGKRNAKDDFEMIEELADEDGQTYTQSQSDDGYEF